MAKFFICEHCKNLITFINNSGVPVVCCGQKMTELVPNTVDAAVEKHVPVVKVEGGKISVTVGEVAHPMTDKHLIEWIALETKNGVQIKKLTANDKPEAVFAVVDEEPVAAYAYCNLHGLWKKEI
ncbi:MAG: desulfoferrodoxin [Clostridia bacterium]|jgi:superoxide reductase|nr:desulfoferrodoxin [Clostridia bacterium]MCI1958468.1 desulfoferrodoxin [Clostridia bacterium]MCI1999820.1 desulfoferrodoxin [Clostridia bacterium]MCI2014264.1 desulfoferrodoxin [Clostridia bacterium]